MVALIEMPGARATLSPRADRPQPEQLALVAGAPSSLAEDATRQLDAAREASFLPGDLTMRTLHTSYRVSNLAASLDFYTALGYEQVGRVDLGANASLTMLKLPGEEVVTLELVHRPAAGVVDIGTGFSHIPVQVDDLPATLGRLSEAGLKPGPVERPGRQDGPQISWLTDPDGYGSNWCSGGRGTLTGSPRPTF